MPTTSAEEITREELRAFHFSGSGLERARPTEKIRLAGLDGILPEVPRLEAAYPLYAAPNQLPRPLIEFPGVDEAAVRAVIALMGDRPLIAAAEARGHMGRGVEEGWLIGFHPDARALLYCAFLAFARRGAQKAFSAEVKRCAAGLEDLLAIDRVSRLPHSADTVAASLGTAARRFLAASALAGIFERHGGRHAAMDPARRERCESILEVLRKALDDQQRDPLLWLFHSDEAPAGVAEFGARSCRHEDSWAAAIQFCEQRLAQFTGILRAVRAARLEIESAFDPEVHSPLLDRLDWRSAEPEELAALPAVAIMERPAQLARVPMASFTRLMRSGLPVQMVVLSSGPFADADAPDFGFVAMAHRAAFVLQSSLARWDHLAAGLVEMTRALRPAMAILSGPAAGEIPVDAWVETALYDLSRAFPLYRYDPGREGEWAERFQWFDAGVYSELRAIQAVAISKRFRDHFRLIPPSAPDQGQIEAAEYFKCGAPEGVPFVPAGDGEGNRWRAVFTRELADFCRDRGRAVEMLSRLAFVPAANSTATGFEAARQEGAAEAYAVVMGLLADPEKLVANARGNSRAGS